MRAWIIVITADSDVIRSDSEREKLEQKGAGQFVCLEPEFMGILYLITLTFDHDWFLF